MRATGLISVLILAICGTDALTAAAPFKYRGYLLESSVATVVATSGTRLVESSWGIYTRPADQVPLRAHLRLVLIQEVEWQPPYQPPGRAQADPVRDVLFSFYDDRLYQIVVTYDRERMLGVTDADVTAALSATYGPSLATLRPVPGALSTDVIAESSVVAQWEDDGTLVTVARGLYSPQVQLILISKAGHPLAHAAVQAALRLKTRGAPEGASDRPATDEAGRAEARRAAVRNRAAFRP